MRVSATQLAKEFGVSRMRISQLASEGVIPKGKDGRFDVLKCYRAYCAFLRKALASRPVPEAGSKSGTIVDARRRKLLADAKLRELELAQTQGSLVSIDVVERSWSAIILETKARMMALGGKIAPELVGETSRNVIQIRIEKAVKEALVALAKGGDSGVSLPAK